MEEKNSIDFNHREKKNQLNLKIINPYLILKIFNF